MNPRTSDQILSLLPAPKAAALTFIGAALLGSWLGAEPSAAPARSAEEGKGFAHVKATFQKLDTDKDGSVSAKEAKAWKVPTAVFLHHDVDKTQSLSADEFVVLYKHLLVQAGRPVAKDLVAEVARIQARRRVRERREAEAKAAAKAAEAKGAKPIKRKGPASGTVKPIAVPPPVEPSTQRTDSPSPKPAPAAKDPSPKPQGKG